MNLCVCAGNWQRLLCSQKSERNVRIKAFWHTNIIHRGNVSLNNNKIIKLLNSIVIHTKLFDIESFPFIVIHLSEIEERVHKQKYVAINKRIMIN